MSINGSLNQQISFFKNICKFSHRVLAFLTSNPKSCPDKNIVSEKMVQGRIENISILVTHTIYN